MTKRLIRESAGPETVKSELRVLEKRLKSRPDTAHLAAAVSLARDVLVARLAEWEEASDDVEVASGGIRYADAIVDDGVADVARRAKVLVDGDLKSPTYVRLFASAASQLTKGLADDTQAKLVSHLAETIAAKDEYEPLRPQAESLTAAHAELLVAKTTRTTEEIEAARAWTELQIAEEAARAVFRDTRPALELLFPGKKRLVDSFFRATKKAPRKAPATPTSE